MLSMLNTLSVAYRGVPARPSRALLRGEEHDASLVLGCLRRGETPLTLTAGSLGEQLGDVQVVWGAFIACGPRTELS